MSDTDLFKPTEDVPIPAMADYGLQPGDVALSIRKGKTRAEKCSLLMRQFFVDYETALAWVKEASR